jgi:tRNA(Ile)-lysidine synthase
MSPLVTRVARSIGRGGLIPPGARVVAAVSGGSDSVALLHVLVDLAPVAGFAVAGLAHLNHRLRGGQSDADEMFCRDLASSLDLPIEVQQTDVGSMARVQRVSVEVAARRARYRFLERSAGRLDADTIATGHTRDDQAETFLLRLLRGAGATGLAAIPPRRGSIVRPLLDERRAVLRDYLRQRGIPFREDASNDDTAIPRNWVRHVLVPLLADHLGGDIVEVLAREAAILREDGVLLDEVAGAAALKVLGPHGPGRVGFDARELQSLPAAVSRRVVRHALARVSPAFQGAAHVQRVLETAGAASDGVIDLPGVRMERKSENVVLYTREGRGFQPSVSFRHALPVPGRIVIPEAGVVIDAELLPAGGPYVLPREGEMAAVTGVIDAASTIGGLWVRSRRPGDSFLPLGLGRRKKLQDVFVDRKVPRERRDRVPLVVDAADRIVWVAGCGPSDAARVTETTQSVVTLILKPLGDLG